MRQYRFFKAIKVAVIAMVAITLFGYVVERLWNWLVPAIIGWKPISFTQALGLLVLSKILFGGFHRHGGGGPRGWKRDMGERWARMTPEERERFRSGMRGRGWCWGSHTEPTQEQVAK
jgi:hypothetical protein